MKRIDAIIKGRKFTDKLFGLKKRQINRALESAKDNAEKQKEDASITYEELFSKLSDDDANYQCIISEMLAQKQIIMSADETIKALDAIKADLEAEVGEPED